MNRKVARRFLLAGASALALLAGACGAEATILSFTGGLQAYIVPATGDYDFVVAGGEGGSSGDGNPGGAGAVVGGEVHLRAGQELDIYVGGAGYSGAFGKGYAGGGGGGTFILGPTRLLFVAGGGGGGGYGDNARTEGRPGRMQRSGSDGRGKDGGYGGSRGYGGEGGQSARGFNGGGGTGYEGPGGEGYYGKNGYSGGGGFAMYGGFPTGAFGGGGGGGYNGGGGGGGFSGGGGGSGGAKNSDGGGGGGGGGSFIIHRAWNTFRYTGENWGDGYVSIDPATAVPEPGTWAMILAGFSALGAMLARRGRQATASV